MTGCASSARFWRARQPGSTSGWDLHLLALARFLGNDGPFDHEHFETSPGGRDFSKRSAAFWGEAHLAAGGEPRKVADAVEATIQFYAPEPT